LHCGQIRAKRRRREASRTGRSARIKHGSRREAGAKKSLARHNSNNRAKQSRITKKNLKKNPKFFQNDTKL
jgi:hypothetical protein